MQGCNLKMEREKITREKKEEIRGEGGEVHYFWRFA